MTKHVIETVLFKLEDGVSQEDFIDAARAMGPFVESQPGFVLRRLSRTEDGTWIEHIEWESLQHAKNAAAAVGAATAARPFLGAINAPSIKMMHSDLEISLN